MARKTVEERLTDTVDHDINAYERASSYSREELLRMVDQFITLELIKIRHSEHSEDNNED